MRETVLAEVAQRSPTSPETNLESRAMQVRVPWTQAWLCTQDFRRKYTGAGVAAKVAVPSSAAQRGQGQHQKRKLIRSCKCNNVRSPPAEAEKEQNLVNPSQASADHHSLFTTHHLRSHMPEVLSVNLQSCQTPHVLHLETSLECTKRLYIMKIML
ncbi:hypothetical protein NDU88_007891 [Pleurodeles waltl]|uniref:Uncharacterized protein n=1 Tax=Pleurodeles waltl TaxID=8319 RepID=A0AAV7STL7_PLEWA|nr:hypothetical protein NDU88_007891 [Pleurodeles waltl]